MAKKNPHPSDEEVNSAGIKLFGMVTQAMMEAFGPKPDEDKLHDSVMSSALDFVLRYWALFMSEMHACKCGNPDCDANIREAFLYFRQFYAETAIADGLEDAAAGRQRGALWYAETLGKIREQDGS